MKNRPSILSLGPGDRGKVKAIHSLPESFSLRCQEMGLFPDVEVEFVRKAPLGSPIEVRVHDVNLLLQEETAKNIEIVPL